MSNNNNDILYDIMEKMLEVKMDGYKPIGIIVDYDTLHKIIKGFESYVTFGVRKIPVLRTVRSIFGMKLLVDPDVKGFVIVDSRSSESLSNTQKNKLIKFIVATEL